MRDDKDKRSVHNAGPLGMLLRSGQISSVDSEDKPKPKQIDLTSETKTSGSYFKTKSGITFDENELTYIDPKQCEPWKYANRLIDDMGDIEDLIQSIQKNKQLQPALVRLHPKPHGDIKYEVIFGRRRHEACLRLNIPFLAIKKDIPNAQDAVVSQEAENRLRHDVSNYSNAILYKKLLEDGIFENERNMAEKLGISLSKIYDIMAYAKIPTEIVKLIPNIHSLSNSLAIKITSLLKENPKCRTRLIAIASDIGKTITSPAKLEKLVKKPEGKEIENDIEKAKMYRSEDGKKLFIFKINHRGAPCIVINREINLSINAEDLCQQIKVYLEKCCN